MFKKTSHITPADGSGTSAEAAFEFPIEAELPVELQVPMPAEFAYRAKIPLLGRFSIGAAGKRSSPSPVAEAPAAAIFPAQADAEDDCGCTGAAAARDPWPERKQYKAAHDKAVYGFLPQQMLAQTRAAERLTRHVETLSIPTRIEVVQGLPDAARERFEKLENGHAHLLELLAKLEKECCAQEEPSPPAEATPCIAATHVMLELSSALAETPLELASILQVLSQYHQHRLATLHALVDEVAGPDVAKLIVADLAARSDPAAFRERATNADRETLDRLRQDIIVHAARGAIDFDIRCAGADDASEHATVATPVAAQAKRKRSKG